MLLLWGCQLLECQLWMVIIFFHPHLSLLLPLPYSPVPSFPLQIVSEMSLKQGGTSLPWGSCRSNIPSREGLWTGDDI